MSYTEGKWEIDKRASRRVKCGDTTIASIGGGQSGDNEDTELANTKLISASPDLLVALKDLVWLLEKGAMSDELDECIDKTCKPAINKALGKTWGINE